MSDEDKYREEFDALTAGLEMPNDIELPSEADEDTDVSEMSDDDIQERVDAVVDGLRVDFFYVTSIRNELEQVYDWSVEGAERLAQLYLERALFRRDLEQ